MTYWSFVNGCVLYRINLLELQMIRHSHWMLWEKTWMEWRKNRYRSRRTKVNSCCLQIMLGVENENTGPSTGVNVGFETWGGSCCNTGLSRKKTFQPATHLTMLCTCRQFSKVLDHLIPWKTKISHVKIITIANRLVGDKSVWKKPTNITTIYTRVTNKPKKTWPWALKQNMTWDLQCWRGNKCRSHRASSVQPGVKQHVFVI